MNCNNIYIVVIEVNGIFAVIAIIPRTVGSAKNRQNDNLEMKTEI